MGVWSDFVCTSPPGLALDVKALPEEVLYGIGLSLESVPEETKTTEDLFAHMSCAPKIIGYLHSDNEKGIAWKGLLQALAEQNKDVECIRIHMYCLDYQYAAWFQLVDGDLTVFEGPKRDCHYHTASWEKEENTFIVDFDRERYISIVNTPEHFECLRWMFTSYKVGPKMRWE